MKYFRSKHCIRINVNYKSEEFSVILKVLTIIYLIIIFHSCVPDPPLLTTNNASSITQTSAASGGNVTDDGGASIISRGICWDNTTNPTMDGSKTIESGDLGPFNSSLTELSPNTLYYVRAYATNKAGTGYGNLISFTTIQSAVPTLRTLDITNVSTNSSTTGGEITNNGGSAITARGVCWSMSQNPTFESNRTNDGTSLGNYSSILMGLATNTIYYVRAYAVNSVGTGYGNQINFVTLPTISTVELTKITANSATSGGIIPNSGNGSIIARGVCWSTSQNPTIATTKTSDGIGAGNFTSTITGLSPNTTYYLRAFCTNVSGTSYGNQLSFSTIPNAVPPTLSTSVITGVTLNSAIGGGNITSDGWSPITSRGVCWSTPQNPTTANNKTSDGLEVGSFTSNITGLLPNTTYYVRAYATNIAGTGYGNQVSFITMPIITLPTISTSTITGVTSNSAVSGGSISSEGGASVLSRGVCWSLNSNPTILDSKTIDGFGSGGFVSNITGLVPGTLFHVRAYAINSVGVAYGNDVTFTTSPIVPTVTTAAVTLVTSSTAVSGGNVNADGGAAVTTRGVCWSTTVNPTTTNNKTSDGTGTGNFTSNLTGLLSGTTYHFRAYATNSVGTSYGEDLTFITSAGLPSVTTIAVSGISQTSASSGGSIVSNGGASVTARGVCWGIQHNPTIAGSHTSDGSGNGSFTSSLLGLTANTVYYVRAYATNTTGTDYGNEITFTTSPTLPTLTTTPISSFTASSALSGGNVINDGGSAVTNRGVCWNTAQNPTIDNSKTSDGAGIGFFTSNITGLTAGTIYYIRAYAVNTAGTSYGNQVTLITKNPWTKKADFKGVARTFAVGFSIGNKGYIGTGMDSNRNLLKDFWEYDPNTNSWTQKADFGGTERNDAVGFSIGNKGYIGTGFNINFLKDFWEYDPSSNAWTKKTDFAGNARNSAVGFSIGTRGYIGTGYFGSGILLKDFWEYNPSTNVWAKKADFGGAGRYDAVGFSIGGKGYIGTGLYALSYNVQAYSNDFWEYDPVTNAWVQKANFGGSERSGAVGFSIDSKGYIGNQDIWEFDPITNSWTRKTDCTGPSSYKPVGFSIGSKVYIISGNDLWEYDPSQDN